MHVLQDGCRRVAQPGNPSWCKSVKLMERLGGDGRLVRGEHAAKSGTRSKSSKGLRIDQRAAGSESCQWQQQPRGKHADDVKDGSGVQ